MDAQVPIPLILPMFVDCKSIELRSQFGCCYEDRRAVISNVGQESELDVAGGRPGVG